MSNPDATNPIASDPQLADKDIWIGSNYRKGGILIIGDSSYVDPAVQYIPRWIAKNEKDQTFSRLFNAFNAEQAHTESATIEQREAFWNSVAFYNFVQEVIPSRDDRPSQAMFRAAKAPLETVLKALQPGGVMIVGYEQREHSEPIVTQLGIPCVVVEHPTAYGVPTAAMTARWQELATKMKTA